MNHPLLKPRFPTENYLNRELGLLAFNGTEGTQPVRARLGAVLQEVADQHLRERSRRALKRSPSYDCTTVAGESLTLDLNAPRSTERIDEDSMAPPPPRVLAGVQVVRQEPVLVERYPRTDALVVRPALNEQVRTRIRMNFD